MPAADPAPSLSRHGAALVALLALVVGLAFQGTRHLYDPDEGRYTDVAHEMVELEDWLVPRLDPERPHFTKPPLTYWALSASFKVFGSNEWSARLPNALAFVATALLVMGIARRLRLPAPIFAACAWITTIGPVLGMNVVTTDTLLVMFESLAVFGFVASGLVTDQAAPRRAGLRLMWLAFGLAFLTKGPPGLLPLAAIVAFVAWRRRKALVHLLDLAGLGLFAVVGLGWFIALIWHSPDLLDYFIRHETLGRVASAEHHRNPGWTGWIVVYLPTLLIGSLPWLPVLLAVRRRATAAVPAAETLPPDTWRFLLLWLTLPFLAFAAAQSRLPLYVLPLFVPLVLVIAAGLGRWPLEGRGAVVGVLAAALLAIGLKGGGALIHSDGDACRLAEELRQAVDLSAIDELVFVDVPARYGLKHYLKLNVEQVESRPGTIGPPGYASPELLCQELAMPERMLLIVPARRLDDVQAAWGKCEGRIERIASLRRWVLFRTLPAPQQDQGSRGTLARRLASLACVAANSADSALS